MRIGHVLLQAVLILLLLSGLALGVNALRLDGLPLFFTPTHVVTAEQGAAVSPIPIEDAAELFGRGGALFLDARSPSEYAKGHIQGALNIPAHDFDEVFGKVADRLEGAQSLVTYCDGEDCPLGRSLAEKLYQLGFRHVSYLVNGWTVWREKALPVSRGEQA